MRIGEQGHGLFIAPTDGAAAQVLGVPPSQPTPPTPLAALRGLAGYVSSKPMFCYDPGAFSPKKNELVPCPPRLMRGRDGDRWSANYAEFGTSAADSRDSWFVPRLG